MLRMQIRVVGGALVCLVVALAARPAAAQVVGHFDKTLKVSGPVTLSITSGDGSVNVVAGGDGAVRALRTVRGNNWREWSGNAVERAVRAVEAKPPIVQNGASISLGSVKMSLFDDFGFAGRLKL